MAKQDEKSKVQVVLFVEGDTDEVLFNTCQMHARVDTGYRPCAVHTIRMSLRSGIL